MSANRFRLMLLVSLLTFSVSAYPSPKDYMQKNDYKSLEFTCSREEDHVPQPTEKAETLFQQAYQAHVKATAGDETNVPLLREAVQGYRQAAEAGHWKAIRNLANLYSTGTGSNGVIKVNQSKTIDYVKELMEMNVATGYNLMAAFANQGWGVRRDPKAALVYERRAADLGDKLAQRHLGNLLYLELARELPAPEKKQVRDIALKMLACAVRQGDREAAFDLASNYVTLEKNYPYALFYYQQGGKMGDATSLFALYEWFKDGEHGYSRDLKRAERYNHYSDRADLNQGPFPDLDKELPLPLPPEGGSYPPPEMGWPNAWTSKR